MGFQAIAAIVVIYLLGQRYDLELMGLYLTAMVLASMPVSLDLGTNNVILRNAAITQSAGGKWSPSLLASILVNQGAAIVASTIILLMSLLYFQSSESMKHVWIIPIVGYAQAGISMAVALLKGFGRFDLAAVVIMLKSTIPIVAVYFSSTVPMAILLEGLLFSIVMACCFFALAVKELSNVVQTNWKTVVGCCRESLPLQAQKLTGLYFVNGHRFALSAFDSAVSLSAFVPQNTFVLRALSLFSAGGEIYLTQISSRANKNALRYNLLYYSLLLLACFACIMMMFLSPPLFALWINEEFSVAYSWTLQLGVWALLFQVPAVVSYYFLISLKLTTPIMKSGMINVISNVVSAIALLLAGSSVLFSIILSTVISASISHIYLHFVALSYSRKGLT